MRESDVSDTFLDSAWYFLRYPSTEFDDRPWDPGRTRDVLPVDFYAGGSEHVQRHHLYARFITMAMYDLGLVPFDEPIPRIRIGGLIILDGAKMSKSRDNVVSPDEYVHDHGIDVLRCALMFSAPWEKGGEFSDNTIAGIERFFARCWQLVEAPDQRGAGEPALSGAITAVTDALERFSFNVALARLMELSAEAGSAQALDALVRMLAPFAPHLAEELWHRMGEDFSVHTQPWPVAAESSIADVEMAVQVDGRLRGVITAPAGASEEHTTGLAREMVPGVPVESETQRVVIVPGRVVNFVTRR
jgi:leucyl-tRNA synthetase